MVRWCVARSLERAYIFLCIAAWGDWFAVLPCMLLAHQANIWANGRDRPSGCLEWRYGRVADSWEYGPIFEGIPNRHLGSTCLPVLLSSGALLIVCVSWQDWVEAAHFFIAKICSFYPNLPPSSNQAVSTMKVSLSRRVCPLFYDEITIPFEHNERWCDIPIGSAHSNKIWDWTPPIFIANIPQWIALVAYLDTILLFPFEITRKNVCRVHPGHILNSRLHSALTHTSLPEPVRHQLARPLSLSPLPSYLICSHYVWRLRPVRICLLRSARWWLCCYWNRRCEVGHWE